MYKIYNLTIYLLLIISLVSCEKFLSIKSDKKLTVPNRIEDLQSILDDYDQLSKNYPSSINSLGDDYQLDAGAWNRLRDNDRNLYIRSGEYQYASGPGNDWVSIYRGIYNANIVLEYISKIDLKNNINRTNDVEGQAYFLRARNHFYAAILWCMAYDPNSAEDEMGIPLRLSSDFNLKSTRSSLKDTYNQIIYDLKLSVDKLPISSITPIRPSKAAAYGLLSRVYLAMGDWNESKNYADSSLYYNNYLMNYNNNNFIKINNSFSFLQFNPEVIYETSNGYPNHLLLGVVDSILYESYSEYDLRKTLYFGGSKKIGNFKGSYSGTSVLFGGIAVDELLLNRSESLIRLGDIKGGMSDLNRLLRTRWDENYTFQNYNTNNKDEALNFVIEERKKSLLFRGLRWMDIKRLNVLGHNIVLTRTEAGITTILNPGDPRYALAIPEDIILISGIPQNRR